MILLALVSVAFGGSFDRVDLLSAGPGTFLNYDVPMLGMDTARSGLRFVEQIQPVWRLPVENLYVATSLSDQSLLWEDTVSEDLGLSYTVGLSTMLLVPRGARATLAWRKGPVRLSAGLSAITPSSWSRVDYTVWTVMPTVGVGLVRKERP